MSSNQQTGVLGVRGVTSGQFIGNFHAFFCLLSMELEWWNKTQNSMNLEVGSALF